MELFGDHLISDDLQFGFKKKVDCPSAIFVFRQLVHFFSNRSSSVYIASLDASKAFDRVNRFRLFSTLINKKFPIVFIKVIINWYSKLRTIVRWNGFVSANLRVLSGFRQGGVLSPLLFNCYVDRIISQLKYAGLGCHFAICYVGCIKFADELLLISSSVLQLQIM